MGRPLTAPAPRPRRPSKLFSALLLALNTHTHTCILSTHTPRRPSSPFLLISHLHLPSLTLSSLLCSCILVSLPPLPRLLLTPILSRATQNPRNPSLPTPRTLDVQAFLRHPPALCSSLPLGVAETSVLPAPLPASHAPTPPFIALSPCRLYFLARSRSKKRRCHAARP